MSHIVSRMCAAIVTSVLLYCVNWEKEMEKAQALVMKATVAVSLMAEATDHVPPPEDPKQHSSGESLGLVFIVFRIM